MSKSIVLMFYKENLPHAQPYACMNGNCRRILLVTNRELLTIVKASGVAIRDIPPGVGLVELKCRGCDLVYKIYYQ